MEPLRERFLMLWGHVFCHLSSSKACFVWVLDAHCTLENAHTLFVCRNHTSKKTHVHSYVVHVVGVWLADHFHLHVCIDALSHIDSMQLC